MRRLAITMILTLALVLPAMAEDKTDREKMLEQRWTNAEIVAQKAIVQAAQLRIELLRRGVHIQQLDAELAKKGQPNGGVKTK